MNLHLVSLPHTTLTERNLTCAYSQKVLKMGKMMRRQGYRVILYGPDESEAECDEHVVITTAEDREAWGFGDGFDTVRTPFLWDANQVYWNVPNLRAIQSIRERANVKEDLLLVIAGWCQHPIAQALRPLLPVEWGVGYEGIFSDYCAFESYAWMHHLYGKREIINGRFYDAVIPNFFDPDDFKNGGGAHEPSSLPSGASEPSGDYLLYVGRLVERKGPHVASMIAERAGLPLVVAGPGVTHQEPGLIVAEEPSGHKVELRGDHITYVGEVGKQERARLMHGARALLVPTLYIEPFGGVAVEAMMCGTPVIATDFGAFTETVKEGVSGARFHTLAEGVEAVQEVKRLNRKKIHKWALDNYSLDAVGPMFDRWFQQVKGLWGKGWDA